MAKGKGLVMGGSVSRRSGDSLFGLLVGLVAGSLITVAYLQASDAIRSPEEWNAAQIKSHQEALKALQVAK